MNLPNFPLKVKRPNGKIQQIRNLDELVVDLLDPFSVTLQGNEYRWLDLQSNDFKYVHPYRVEKLKQFGDIYQQTYTIGRQFETSTYYDTPQGLPVALRMKKWFGIDADGRIASQASARTLFIKTLPDNAQAIASHRIEYQLPLSDDMSDQEVELAMRALLKEAGVQVDRATPIQPKVEIENTRYGVDIVLTEQYGRRPGMSHKTPKKIGFMTIDSYIRTEKGKEADKPVLQFEYELLPRFQHLLSEIQTEFIELFQRIENRYSAVENPVPKYIKNEPR